MMEAVRTSETQVNFNVTTRHYIPEDSNTSYSPPWEPEISHFILFACSLFNDAFSVSQTIVSNEIMIRDKCIGRMWKEAVGA
jgi:hypothetical protein